MKHLVQYLAHREVSALTFIIFIITILSMHSVLFVPRRYGENSAIIKQSKAMPDQKPSFPCLGNFLLEKLKRLDQPQINTWLPIYLQVEGDCWGGVDWRVELYNPAPEWNRLEHICVKQLREHQANTFAAEYHDTNWISNCFRRIITERQNPERGPLMGNACLQFS